MTDSLKEMVRDGKKAYFLHARLGDLYYKTECGFIFRVPIEEMGDAEFLAEEKTITLMRWLRRELAL